MSTRCHVIVKDEREEIWFYRHSDGYPSGTGEALKEFLKLILDRTLRSNAQQSAGWLILLGHKEYGSLPAGSKDKWDWHVWKVGAYEPCSPGVHGDAEYVYVVDLAKEEIRCYSPEGFQNGTPFYVINKDNIEQTVGERLV